MKNRSEASTFAGIPIPLTMETLLDVYRRAVTDRTGMAERQAEAIRARILRMDAKKDKRISGWEYSYNSVLRRNIWLNGRVNSLVEQLADKDARIAELEKQVDDILLERS